MSTLDWIQIYMDLGRSSREVEIISYLFISTLIFLSILLIYYIMKTISLWKKVKRMKEEEKEWNEYEK